MAKTVLSAGSKRRKAAVLLTAAAVLLPLPASCLACPRGQTDCPRCAAAQDPAAPTASSPCCRRHAAAQHVKTFEQSNHLLTSDGKPLCRCEQPTEQPIQTALLPAPSIEPDAGLPSASVCSANATAADVAAAPPGPADLFPAIPHRILHCSWQI